MRLAFLLGLFTSTSAFALSPPPMPTSTGITSFQVANLRGQVVKTRVQIVGAGQQELVIRLRKGDQQTELWRHTYPIKQRPGGSAFLIEVDTQKQWLRDATLEAELTSCADQPDCRKAVTLNVGDVQILANPEFPAIGRANVLVQNFGPADSPACKLVITVNRQYHRTIPIKPLVVNQDFAATFTYDRHQRRRSLAATLKCTPGDLATANNHRYLGTLP